MSLLKESIDEVGLINPPLLKERPHGTYQIVCGYKRLLACREIGMGKLGCGIVDHTISERETFLISLYDNLSHRQFNTIEKAIVVNALQNFHSVETIISTFLPLMALSAHHSVLNRIKPLIHLDKEFKDAVAEGSLDERAAVKLLSFSHDERKILFGLLLRLRFGKNKQNEIIDTIHDIVKRDGCPVSEVLDSKELRKVLDDPNLNIPQKGERVRNFLRKLRYPRITQAEEGFMEMKRGLNLGENIKLIHPPFFEGEKWRIEFQFSTTGELKENIEKLGSVANEIEFTKTVNGGGR
ncbi:MAG: ParB/RepB/Spo0J family partition protein [Thermodesulfobacteriota bacterium]|nr:ParB/RepB/Spo0J family partition protein [Thermodesulfobacteriota bacterium]